MTYDPVEHSQRQMRAAQERDTLNRVTGQGKYAKGPTDGMHFGLGPVVFGALVKLFRKIQGRGTG
jgi:hypothetical protein